MQFFQELISSEGREVEKFGVQSVVFVGTAPGYKYYVPKNVFIQIVWTSSSMQYG